MSKGLSREVTKYHKRSEWKRGIYLKQEIGEASRRARKGEMGYKRLDGILKLLYKVKPCKEAIKSFFGD